MNKAQRSPSLGNLHSGWEEETVNHKSDSGRRANAGETRDTGVIPGSKRSPAVGMATCSMIQAWKIPWTKELGRLQSMGLQRVRHDWATEHTHTDDKVLLRGNKDN